MQKKIRDVVRFLGWEDPLEKEMATYSSILTWKIPWTEDPGGLQSTALQRFGHDLVTNTFTFKMSSITLVFFMYSCRERILNPKITEQKLGVRQGEEASTVTICSLGTSKKIRCHVNTIN